MKSSSVFIIIFISFFIMTFSDSVYAKKAAIVIDYDSKEILFDKGTLDNFLSL